MCAPSAASKRACPAPMPRPAPVTIAIFPSSSPIAASLAVAAGKGQPCGGSAIISPGKMRFGLPERNAARLASIDASASTRRRRVRMCLAVPRRARWPRCVHRLSPAHDDVVARLTGGATRGRSARRRRSVRAPASWPRSWSVVVGVRCARTKARRPRRRRGRGTAPAGACASAGETTSDAPQATPAARRTSGGRERGAPAQAAAECGHSRRRGAERQAERVPGRDGGGGQPRRREHEASPSLTTVAVSVGRVAVRATIETATAASNERTRIRATRCTI